MKKKFIAMLLTASLAASWTVPAFAEETETETASSEALDITFDETQAPYEGNWITFEAGFKLYLPSDWDVQEISEDDANDGVIFWISSPDDKGWNLNVMYVPAEEGDEDVTLEEVAASLEEDTENYTGIELGTFNDIDVIAYDSADETASGILFLDTEGGAYTINCAPTDDDDFKETAFAMLTSLSVADEDTETESESAAE